MVLPYQPETKRAGVCSQASSCPLLVPPSFGLCLDPATSWEHLNPCAVLLSYSTSLTSKLLYNFFLLR